MRSGRRAATKLNGFHILHAHTHSDTFAYILCVAARPSRILKYYLPSIRADFETRRVAQHRNAQCIIYYYMTVRVCVCVCIINAFKVLLLGASRREGK